MKLIIKFEKSHKAKAFYILMTSKVKFTECRIVRMLVQSKSTDFCAPNKIPTDLFLELEQADSKFLM